MEPFDDPSSTLKLSSPSNWLFYKVIMHDLFTEFLCANFLLQFIMYTSYVESLISVCDEEEIRAVSFSTPRSGIIAWSASFTIPHETCGNTEVKLKRDRLELLPKAIFRAYF